MKLVRISGLRTLFYLWFNQMTTHSWIKQVLCLWVLLQDIVFNKRGLCTMMCTGLEVCCFEVKPGWVRFASGILTTESSPEIWDFTLALFSLPNNVDIIIQMALSRKHLTHLSVDCAIMVMLSVTCTMHCIRTSSFDYFYTVNTVSTHTKECICVLVSIKLAWMLGCSVKVAVL